MDPQLRELIELNNRIKRRDRIGVGICLVGIVVTILLLKSGLFLVGIGICVIGLILLIITAATLNKDYRQKYKQTLVNRVASEYFDEYTYDPVKGFARDYLRKLNIMMFGSDYKSEDQLKAVYDGVRFTRADVYIADTTTDAEGNSSTIVYFRGQWIEFEPNKDFNSDLQIIQKGFSYTNKQKGLFVKKADKRHVIETEDTEFNKRFQCLCQDDSEAFYLLTPSLMQSLMQLTEVLPYKIMIGYIDKSIHVLVDTHRDSMEPSGPKGGSFDRQIADIRQDMDVIVSVINGLKINTDLYRRH